MAEFNRSEAELPRVLYQYDVFLDRVLDFLVHETLTAWGTSKIALTGDNLQYTRRIGVDAFNNGYQAIRSWSATGVGSILAVFLNAVTPEQHLKAQYSETWE